MKRRAALKSLAVVGSASVAGCTSLPFVGTSGVVLGKIEVINETFVSNRIRLIVARENRPGKLLDRMISLAAYDSADSAHGIIIHPSWPKTEGKYRLIATHYDDSGEMESDSSKYTFTQADVDRYYDDYEEPDCLGALVKIGSRTDDTEKDTLFWNPDITISPTYMDNPC